MDPLVTSTLLQTGGNLLGGLFGGGGMSNKQASNLAVEAEERAMKNAKAMARTYPIAQMEGWKAAGIHPLAGLGMSVPSTASYASVGGDTGGSKLGNALSEAGQGVSRAVAAYATREERELARYSSKLSLENQQLQNDRLRSEIALMHQAGSPPGMSMAGSDSDARYPSQSHMPMGFGNTAPLLRVGRDQKGNPIRVYNDDLGDNELLQALTAFGFSVPDWLHGNITKPAAKKLRSFAKFMNPFK